MTKLVPCAVLVLVYLQTTGDVGRVEAAVYNLHLVTDNQPDYTNIESFVASVTQRWHTPQQKCIAIWRWGCRSRRQTSCATEDGRLVWDPILHYNSYGAMNCGVISALNIACFQQLGYDARYVQLGDHTVSEVSWDKGKSWHMFDSSMSFFCFNHAGQVASCQEIREAHSCKLSGGKSEPGHFYLYHGAMQCRSHLGPDGWRCAGDQPVAYQRTLLNGAASFTDGFSVSKYSQYGRYGRQYILNLRPHETYTRYWKPLDRDNSNVTEEEKPDYFRPLKGDDPDNQHGLNNFRGNGVWSFQPQLSNTDCRTLLYNSHGIATRAESGTGPHVHPANPGEPASVVFKVSAANVITSMQIEAEGLRSDGDDDLQVLVSRTAGLQWSPVWQSRRVGAQTIDLSLRDQVAGVTECLVKVNMTAENKNTDVGLDAIKLTTTTQLNRRTLPKLTLGTNRVRLLADQQVESTVLWPTLHAGQYRNTVFREEGVYSDEKPDGCYKATIGAGVNGKECSATWRLDVPTDITDVTYGVVATNRSSNSYVSLRHSFDGNGFEEFYRKSDGNSPFDKQVLHTVANSQVPPATRQTYIQCAFFCRGGAATYGTDGIQDLLIRVHHKPRDPRFEPVEVTYNWTEHRETGDVTRSHTERVTSLPHRYVINTSGVRDPTMNSVSMSLAGYQVEEPSAPGYSDGEDVGSIHERAIVTHDWGRNLAHGNSYSASRPSSNTSKNPDSGGFELTNGIIIAPTDHTSGQAIQAATAFWDAGDPVTLIVDLGGSQPVAGARVSTHQPNAQYGHPAQVKITVSTDGETWQPAGTINHNDLWYPPGDYEPWEHDDDPSYDHLPAGGRLAYSFPVVFQNRLSARYVRFVCTPLAERGMGLAELEVFDRVSVVPRP